METKRGKGKGKGQKAEVSILVDSTTTSMMMIEDSRGWDGASEGSYVVLEK